MRRVWSPLLALGLAAIVASVGCTSSGGATKTDAAARGEAFHGPGSPIVAGLTVQPGSSLVAATFPDQADAGGNRLWRSLLRVTGNPAQVFGSYVDRLGELGIRFDSSNCSSVPLNGSEPSAKSTKYLECSAFGTSVDPGAELVSTSVTLLAPPPGAGDFATSLSLESVQREPGAPPATLSKLQRYFSSLPTRSLPPASRSPLVAAYRSNPGPATLPTTGEQIAPSWMDPGVGLRAVEGSVLLAAAAPLDGGSAGWVTVARLTGQPEKVMNAYIRQRPQAPIRSAEELVDGHKVLRRSWDSVGGPKLFLTAVQVAGGAWFLRINVQND